MPKFKDFLNITSAIAPVWYKDNLIFYLYNKTGTYQIYAYNINNKTTKQYTNYRDSIISYNISDSLDLLIFTKALQGDEQAQIYTINIITGEKQQLTNDSSIRHNLGSLSNSQEYITYSSNQRNGKDMDIYIMSLRTNEKRLVRNSNGNAYTSSFSPNDNYLTILQNTTNVTNEIFIYDLINNKELQLTDNNDSLSVRCTWLDNNHIVTNSNVNNNHFRLITYDIKTCNYKDLLQEQTDNDIIGYELSPQKDMLFTLSNKNGYTEPRLFKLHTDKPTLITSNYKVGLYRGVSYSCDGKLLA